MQISVFVFAASFLFGCIIGSFLNVVILRLPDPAASIVFPSSHCPHCKKSLSVLRRGGGCGSRNPSQPVGRAVAAIRFTSEAYLSQPDDNRG